MTASCIWLLTLSPTATSEEAVCTPACVSFVPRVSNFEWESHGWLTRRGGERNQDVDICMTSESLPSLDTTLATLNHYPNKTKHDFATVKYAIVDRLDNAGCGGLVGTGGPNTRGEYRCSLWSRRVYSECGHPSPSLESLLIRAFRALSAW